MNNNNNNKDIKTLLKEADELFQLIPSKTECTDHDNERQKLKYVRLAKKAKALRQLIKETEGLKKQLETQMMNTKHSQLFLTTVGDVIYVLDLFLNEFEVELPPLDRSTGEFLERYDRVPWQHNKCMIGKRGWRYSRCFFVLPDFYSHAIVEVISATGSETYKAHEHALDPNRKVPHSDDLYFDEKKKKIWMDFQEFENENVLCVEEVTRSIELDHPIVSVIASFAVDTFNKQNVNENGHTNDLHDIEFMEFRYLRDSKAYYFDMTIEAIEEGNLGVYETQVVCSRDRDKFALTKFVLTDRKPVGTKAIAISLFSCLKYVCKTLSVMTFNEVRELGKILDIVRGKHQGMVVHKQAVLLDLCSESIIGICQLLLLGLGLFFSPDCNRKTNPVSTDSGKDDHSRQAKKVGRKRKNVQGIQSSVSSLRKSPRFKVKK